MDSNYIEKISGYIDLLEEKQSECVAIIQECPAPTEYIKQGGRLNAFMEVQIDLEKLLQ